MSSEARRQLMRNAGLDNADEWDDFHEEFVSGGLTALPLGGGVTGLRSAYTALRQGGISGLKVALGLPAHFSMSSGQFGAKWGKHAADFGLDVSKAGDRAKFKGMVESIGTRPDRIVSGTFRGQGASGSRGRVQFRIKGKDVVVTSPKGDFVTILRNGINNPSVQNALKQTCTGSHIRRVIC